MTKIFSYFQMADVDNEALGRRLAPVLPSGSSYF